MSLLRKLSSIKTQEGPGVSEGIAYYFKLEGKKKSATYTLRLGDFSGLTRDQIFQTQVFEISGCKWSVLVCRCLRPNLSGEVLHVYVRSENSKSLGFDCRVSMIHPQDNKNSQHHRKNLYMSPYDLTGPCFDYGTARALSEISGSERSLKIEVKIKTVLEVPAVCATFGVDTRVLSIEGLSDGAMARYVTDKKCFGVISMVQQRCSVVQCNSLVEAFTSSATTARRFWLCHRIKNGDLSVVTCLNATATPQMTFGDLLGAQAAANAWITLFAEAPGCSGNFPTVTSSTMMLFCKFYDPVEKTLSYKGQVLLEPNVGCHVLYEKAALCAGIDKKAPYRIYLESADTVVAEISRFSFVDETALASGSVVIIRPDINGETVDEETVLAEFLGFALNKEIKEEVALDGPSLTLEPDPSTPPAKAPPAEEEDCVICLSRPQTSGFVHGQTSHRCVCEDCARKIMSTNHPLCPLCMADVDHVVMRFY